MDSATEDLTQGQRTGDYADDPTRSPSTGGQEPDADPTRGRDPEADPYADPAQGQQSASTSDEDPTQGRTSGALPGEDPTQAR
jgi:hypothetical protein